jgi:hypothetical protein
MAIGAVKEYKKDTKLTVLGEKHVVIKQNTQPVIHPFGIGLVFPVPEEMRGVAEGKPSFRRMNFQGKRYAVCPEQSKRFGDNFQ